MKKILAIILICITVLFTGCEGRIELNDLLMITMMGIDWDDKSKEYEVTLNVVRYNRVKQKMLVARDDSWIVSAKGKTPKSAVANIDERSSRHHSGAGLRLVLIGKQAGEKKMEEIIDFLERNRDYRASVDILSTDTQASEIMKLLPEHEFDIRKEIEGSLTQSDWMRAFTPMLRQVYVDYTEHNGDFVTGAVFEASPKPFNEIPRKEGEVVENPYGVAYVIGSAVYKKGRLVGFMDSIDTRSYLLITRKSDGINQRTDAVPNIKDEKENIDATLEIKSLSSKISADLNNNKITVNIIINLDSRVDEFATPRKVDIKTEDLLRQLLSKKIKNQAESIIRKTQQVYHSDIFGICSILNERYPQFWKENKSNWDAIYPDIDFNVTVNSKVTGTGLITNSIGI